MILEEFKKFAVRGNLPDLAAGIVIGAAFTTVVNSFVADILMPPIGLALGRVDFQNLFINLSDKPVASVAAAKAAGAATINYGIFINQIINFIIVAFAVFLFVRWMNRLSESMTKPAPAAAATTKECPQCASVIPLKARRCAHCTQELVKA
jgi:large conductance mechanosensitive channel